MKSSTDHFEAAQMDWRRENGSNEKRLLNSTRVGIKIWVVAIGAALRRDSKELLEMNLTGFGNQ